jgi:hypothetical protein
MRGADRPMRIGYLESSSTQAATAAEEVVYVDLLFEGMEPETRNLHLLVAQPIGVRFTSRGYR